MSKLIIEPSPHIKSGVTTQKIMLSVIIALLPALVASVWIFGLRALIMTVICCTSCVIFEWACRKIMKKKQHDKRFVRCGNRYAPLRSTCPSHCLFIWQ